MCKKYYKDFNTAFVEVIKMPIEEGRKVVDLSKNEPK